MNESESAVDCVSFYSMDAVRISLCCCLLRYSSCVVCVVFVVSVIKWGVWKFHVGAGTLLLLVPSLELAFFQSQQLWSQKYFILCLPLLNLHQCETPTFAGCVCVSVL